MIGLNPSLPIGDQVFLPIKVATAAPAACSLPKANSAAASRLPQHHPAASRGTRLFPSTERALGALPMGSGTRPTPRMVTSVRSGNRQFESKENMFTQFPTPLLCMRSTARSLPSQAPLHQRHLLVVRTMRRDRVQCVRSDGHVLRPGRKRSASALASIRQQSSCQPYVVSGYTFSPGEVAHRAG
jgi:hypothetical protein